MKTKYIKYLACPQCRGDLIIQSIEKQREDIIESGLLSCLNCHENYPIIRCIPRFVPIENYASSFGLEWNIHAKTQYDSYSGHKISEDRFFNETKWPRNLLGETILEVGCGSGRFTEQAASTGALVVSMDYSSAVEANYQSNGSNENVLIVQGDIYSMPFKKKMFDKLFCIGVLQHTPDPYTAFMSLAPFLKNNGKLVVDFYKKTLRVFLSAKYYIRPFTTEIPPDKLYNIVRKYVDMMWPLSSLIRKIPQIGPMINWALCIADYSRRGLKGSILKEWACLDTFDMLSPRYDYPQTLKTIMKWFDASGFRDIDVHYGYNGIEGRATVCWDEKTEKIFLTHQ